MCRYNYFLTAIIIVCFFIPQSLHAQIQQPGTPPSFHLKTLKSQVILPESKLKKLNINRLLKEDENFPTPMRYAIHEELNIDIRKSGHVASLKNGKIYRYTINGQNAVSMNLVFSKYHLPAGAELYIYDSAKELVFGAFTHLNNKSHGKLAVAEYPSNECTIEYFEPASVEFNGELTIGSVGKSYRDITGILYNASTLQILNHVDINCPVGDDYQLEKHSICRMTFKVGRSSFLCSGSLINNSSFDGTPYFLTAHHCISSDTVAQTLVTYFNYEKDECNSNTIVATNKTISGATLRATKNTSDFTLLELSETPNASYQPYYAGWSIEDVAPAESYSIHHPSGDVKKIAVELDSAISYPIQITWPEDETSPPNSHWQVIFDIGSTQGGSSGSPLFNQHNKIVGQLHGGSNGIDYYGKMSESWDDLFTNRALKYWLDPEDTGISQLDGYIPDGIRPDAHFSTKLTNACLAAPVQLTDKTSFKPSSWEWEVNSPSVSFVNGTNPSSQNPVISFNSPGEYSITLTASNENGISSQTFTDYLTVDEEINIDYLISSDRRICFNDFTNYEVIGTGAQDYQWSLLPDTANSYLNLTSDNERLVITRNSNMQIDTSFETYLVLIGSHGWCTDASVINLSFVYPFNDMVANAHPLKFGLNGPFSNKCAGIQNNEPVPPFGDCNSQDAWCDEYGTGENIVENSIWYTFTGPSSGVVGIETRGFDNQIAVYEADQYQDLISGNEQLYNVIAANDDYNPEDYSATIEEVNVTPGKKYWVQVDGSGGGENGIFTIDLKNSPISTDAIGQTVTEQLSLYPNPATSEVNVQLPSNLLSTGEMMNLSIVSFDGKLVYSCDYVLYQNNLSANVKDFDPGFYVVQVTVKGKRYAGKIVVQ